MPSCLKPYLEEITQYRRNGKTYREIVEVLKNKHDLEVERGNLWRWLQTQRKRASKLVEELQPFKDLTQMQSTNKTEEEIKEKSQKKIQKNVTESLETTSRPSWFPKEREEEELDLRFDDGLSRYKDSSVK